jgi:competence protein ComEC
VIDGRLLLPAGGAWLGAALATWALSLPPSMVARQEAGARGLAAGVGSVLLVAVIQAVPAVRRRLATWGQSVVLVIGCLLLGATSAAMASASSTAPPLAAWIDARATAVVQGEVAGEPLVRVTGSAPVWQSSSRVEVRLDADRISARGESVEVDVPVMLSLPPEAVVPPPGTVIEVTGRLRAVPQRLGAVAALSVSGGPGGIAVHGPPGVVDAIAHAMRAGLRESLADAPAAAGSLVAGLAVGDDSWQPPELATAMRDSGLSHLTAVSGGNVAIVLGLVFALVTLLRLPLPARVSAAIAALGYFVVLVGPQPSVLRAAAMGVIAVAGVLAGGRRSGPSILGAGVLVLVLVAPWLAVSWAFALSAFATGGLILLAPRLEGWLAVERLTCRLPPAIRQALALTGAAQLATLPILVAMGGAVGWVALPANLLAMPAVAPVTVLGLLAAAVSPVAPWLAHLMAAAAAWPAGWIARVAQACADLPLARLPWPEGGTGLLLLCCAAAAAVILRQGWIRQWPAGAGTGVRFAGGAALLTALALVVAMPPDRRGWPPAGWLLIMCDVGQGDALIVRAGPGAALVVDAGPEPDAVDDCLDAAGITAVPAVILTHFHADHVRGLRGVLRGRSVAAVLATPIREPAEEAEAVDEVLATAGMTIEEVTAGDTRSAGAVEWRTIWPRRRIASGSVPNNASLVLALTVADRRILLTGDIEPEAQAAVAADLQLERFDVVKVPHHGSRYQSPLLTSWAPAPVALISVGAGNDYGHPAPLTVDSWTAIGALVARTDRDGDVAVVSSDSGLGVVTRGAGALG